MGFVPPKKISLGGPGHQVSNQADKLALLAIIIFY